MQPLTMNGQATTYTIHFVYYDEQGNPIQGVGFDLNKETIKLQSVYSDEKGQVKFTNVDRGIYTIMINEHEDKHTFSDYEVSIDGSKQEYNLGVIRDFRERASILVKVEDVKKNPIAGMEFAVVNEQDKILQKVKVNTLGECKIEDLAIGKYYLKQTTFEQTYAPKKEDISFVITKGNYKSDLTIYVYFQAKEHDSSQFLGGSFYFLIILCTIVCCGGYYYIRKHGKNYFLDHFMN